jgi:hypothetical protein
MSFDVTGTPRDSPRSSITGRMLVSVVVEAFADEGDEETATDPSLGRVEPSDGLLGRSSVPERSPATRAAAGNRLAPAESNFAMTVLLAR